MNTWSIYLKEDNNTVLAHPSLFTALDRDGDGSLDFEETIVLYYIMQSGRALFCKCCDTFLADVYFSCFQCFCLDESASTYDLCCDCYGGKRFTHHDDAIFWDNYTLLSQSRSLALEAPVQVINLWKWHCSTCVSVRFFVFNFLKLYNTCQKYVHCLIRSLIKKIEVYLFLRNLAFC